MVSPPASLRSYWWQFYHRGLTGPLRDLVWLRGIGDLVSGTPVAGQKSHLVDVVRGLHSLTGTFTSYSQRHNVGRVIHRYGVGQDKGCGWAIAHQCIDGFPYYPDHGTLKLLKAPYVANRVPVFGRETIDQYHSNYKGVGLAFYSHLDAPARCLRGSNMGHILASWQDQTGRNITMEFETADSSEISHRDNMTINSLTNFMLKSL